MRDRLYRTRVFPGLCQYWIWRRAKRRCAERLLWDISRKQLFDRSQDPKPLGRRQAPLLPWQTSNALRTLASQAPPAQTTMRP